MASNLVRLSRKFPTAVQMAVIFAMGFLVTTRGATITVLNADGAGVGFNDPTAVAPIGGNTGTTRGEQRLKAIQKAAEIWGNTVASTVTIVVRAQFAPNPALFCDANSATLGSAGPWDIAFAAGGVPLPNTLYTIAEFNMLTGVDNRPANPDIGMSFNGNLDNNNNCLNGTNWYYGLDHNEGNDIDLLATALHEIAHGLGFLNFVNETNGQFFNNMPDVYSVFTLDPTVGKRWDQMNNAERATSAKNCGNVVWAGQRVMNAAPSFLSLGTPRLLVNSPAGIADDYQVGPALPTLAPLASPGVTAPVQLVNDGSGTITDGCQSLLGFTPGNIALMDRNSEACTTVDQINLAAAAGASAALIVDSSAGCPPPSVNGAGTTIPAAQISVDTGNLIKGQLPSPGVNATLGLDAARRQGVDPFGFVQIYATNPVQSGSSISHFDTIATPNLLMEPSLTSSLTSSLDLTPHLLADIGWTILNTADLSITKTDNLDPVAAGSALTYTITVTNNGPNTANDVVVTDTLPAGVTFVSTSGCNNDPNGVPGCNLGTMVSGLAKQFTVSVNVNGGTGGTITNTASVSSSTVDPNLSNQSASEPTLVLAGPLPPDPVSVTPSSGSGGSATFSYLFSDPNGFADISWAQVIINESATALNSCSAIYLRASNQLYLVNDADTAWIGPVTVGVAGTVQNSACRINSATSSVSGASANLTLNLAVTFKREGAKQNWVRVVDGGGLQGGWAQRGTWNAVIPAQAPDPVSVTPSSGSGSSATFSYLFSDPNGFADISWAQMIINESATALNSCAAIYFRASNQLYLVNDADTAWIGPVTVGVAGTLENSACRINSGASSFSGASSDLTLNLAVIFKRAGAKQNWVRAVDLGGLQGGWIQRGTWTATNLAQPPDPVSVTPNSGSGGSATFSYLFTDPNGYADISWAQVIVNESATASNSCSAIYFAASNQLYLVNDANTAWLGPALVGSAGALENTACRIDLGASSVSVGGSNLTLNLNVLFNRSGAKQNWVRVVDLGGLQGGWVQRGTWTAP